MGAAKRAFQANDDDLRAFAAAFNRIDREVRRRAGMRDDVGTFREAIAKAIAAGDPVVRRHRRRLNSIAQLRNSVTHQETADLWAPLPSRRAIAETKALAERIAGADRQGLAFFTRTTADACSSDTTIQAFADAHSEAVPVVDDAGRLRGAVTVSRLLRWVASFENVDTSKLIVNIVDETAGTEWRLAGRDVTVEQVFAMLEAPATELVVITEHGAVGERVLGWFTVNDLPRLGEAL